MLPDPSQVEQLIRLSDERDLYRRFADLEFRRGYAAAYQQGFTDGYAQSEADMSASWHKFAGPIAHPERHAAERMRNAMAFSRREALEHEREFVARAYATPPQDRNFIQDACVHAYEPPARSP